MSADYERFLTTKRLTTPPVGFDVDVETLNSLLFPFQRDIVRWALARGRAAIWADCGLGKSAMQLEWAHHVAAHTDGNVLILAPLAVSHQTAREGAKFGIAVTVCETQADIQPGINITNYEKLHHFDPSTFAGIVLDESSILKAYDGKTRTHIITSFARTPYRLACTATPAPNDYMELGNHAEFLGIMSRVEMLSMFFTHDGGETQKWRLKGHAESEYWRWLCSWAVMLRSPADLGYAAAGFILPPLDIHSHTVDTEMTIDGMLFGVEAQTLTERRNARRASLGDRVAQCVTIVHTESKRVRDEQRRQESGSQGVHARVSTEEPGQVEANAGAAGTGECAQSGTVRTGRRTADQGAETSQRLADSEPRQEKSSTPEEARYPVERLSGSDGDTARAVCNLRVRGYEQSELLPGSGSRPQDGESTGPVVYELQSGAREVQGRSRSADDGSIVPAEKWLIWCNLNAEQDALEKAFGADCVSIQGSTPWDKRIEYERAWREGAVPILISKPEVFGFGMNWQHCPNVAFVGLSDSYEAYYQAIRRCWRFGQQQTVNCHIITSTLEGAVVANIQRKEEDARHMATEMVEHMKDINTANIRGASRDESAYVRDVAHGRDWTAHLGDCVEVTREMASESIDYSIFSPPFASLYTYSNSDRDMGNARTHSEFYAHFSFLVDELFRVIRPGRLVSFHCMNLPTSKERDGYIGISDFRGELIKMFQRAGFIYHSEVVIWKDPVTAMQRTKALGLLYKQLKKDSAMSRQGIPDYLVTMRKPGINPDPVTKDPATFPVNLWQRYASPVWFDINPSNTLQRESAREAKDERHIAPLQLEVVERAIELWTNPGDVVFTPFLGIGTEAYVAVKKGRRGVGAELKPSYFKQAVANLQAAEHEKDQPTIFDLIDAVEEVAA